MTRNVESTLTLRDRSDWLVAKLVREEGHALRTTGTTTDCAHRALEMCELLAELWQVTTDRIIKLEQDNAQAHLRALYEASKDRQ